jgi:hypothetical protein
MAGSPRKSSRQQPNRAGGNRLEHSRSSAGRQDFELQIEHMVAYILGWFGLCGIAIANGVLREKTYGRKLGELGAHQLSTVLAIVATTVAVYGLTRYFPLRTYAMAWRVGVSWLLMTVVFEFAFGHFVAKHSWRRLLADYNLFAGRVWGVFLVWLVALPVIVHWLETRGI